MKPKIVKIGTVGVDSGQLIICDPCYIDESWKSPPESPLDHAHEVFVHKATGKLWQFAYGSSEIVNNVYPFPGTYANVIPEYGKSPNDLIASGEFEKTNIDPTPHIPKGEFSYRGICKEMRDKFFTSLNHENGYEGLAVSCMSGFGDGGYQVYAEVVDYGQMGERVKRLIIEFINDEEINRAKHVFGIKKSQNH